MTARATKTSSKSASVSSPPSAPVSLEALSLEALRFPRPSELTLSQVIAGVGVPPDFEVYNGTTEGFEAYDMHGNPCLVTVYRSPSADRYDDNRNPPEMLTVQCRELSPEGDLRELVHSFRIPYTVSAKKRRQYSEALATAANLLGLRVAGDSLGEPVRDTSSFAKGWSKLEELVSSGRLERETYSGQTDTSDTGTFDTGPLEPRMLPEERREFEERLSAWLTRNGVNHTAWGHGSKKSLSDLADELLRGEGRLIAEHGGVYLENNVIVAWVENPQGSHRLIELKQEFKRPGEHEEHSRPNLGQLPAEKVKPGENLEEAVVRFCHEELKAYREIQASGQGNSLRVEPCRAYPGLLNRNHYYFYRIRLHEKDCQAEYVEEGQFKRTVITWVPIPSDQPKKPLRGRSRSSEQREDPQYGKEGSFLGRAWRWALDIPASVRAAAAKFDAQHGPQS